jgi:hypothetical protein
VAHYDFAALSPDDVWAVGTRFTGSRQRSLVERWDGERWRVLATPARSGTLDAVARVAAREAWAIGRTTDFRPFVLHWDGRRWRGVPAPPQLRDARMLVAPSAGRAWVYPTGSDDAIMEWDGTRWRAVRGAGV